MNKKRLYQNLPAFIILMVLLLSACGSPATTAATSPAEAPASAVASTATKLPDTPTPVPPTAIMLPPTATDALTPTPAPTAEGELTVMVGSIQVERGVIPWMGDFTASTGCEVSLVDFVDYDQSLSLINDGGIDVVMAGASSGRLIAAGVIEEIDISRVPSWETIDPIAREANWNSVDDKIYGVPYLWIPNVLMYNTNVFPTPPSSWNVVFEEQTLPDGRSSKGRVLAPVYYNYIADAALFLMKSKPEVDITDPYQLTESQLSMATELLYKQRQILGAYWYSNYPMEDFEIKGYAVTQSVPGAVKLMSEAGIPVSSTVPQEGSTSLAFTNMLLENAPHPVCAYQWMEYSIDAKVQGDTAATFGANPFVAAACDGASELLSTEDCERNGFDHFDEFYNIQTPLADCGDGRNDCTGVDRWTELYTELVGQ